MNILLNGIAVAIEKNSTVQELIEKRKVAGQRLIIELNGNLVNQADWPLTKIEPGDRMEIVKFVGGG